MYKTYQLHRIRWLTVFDKFHAQRAYKCKNEKFRTMHQSGKISKQQQQMLTDEKDFHDVYFYEWQRKRREKKYEGNVHLNEWRPEFNEHHIYPVCLPLQYVNCECDSTRNYNSEMISYNGDGWLHWLRQIEKFASKSKVK